MDESKPKHNGPQKVLITGCSSGFGLYTAVKAAQKGCQVIATMRNLDKAQNLEIEAGPAMQNITIEQLDVTNPVDADNIARKYPDIDILINNAGILITGSFLDLTDEEIERIFQTNYFGPMRLTRAYAPKMMENRSGRIINIASLAGRVGHPFNSAYSASKHALIGFTRSIAIELAPFGIQVVSVDPGYHKTEIIRANANVSENFYNPDSPMFEYNRGFLRLMRDEIIPRAGESAEVVDLILKIMENPNPKPSYTIGKDARFALTAYWLGLGKLLRKEVLKKLKRAVRRENRRAESRKAKRKKKTS